MFKTIAEERKQYLFIVWIFWETVSFLIYRTFFVFFFNTFSIRNRKSVLLQAAWIWPYFLTYLGTVWTLFSLSIAVPLTLIPFHTSGLHSFLIGWSHHNTALCVRYQCGTTTLHIRTWNKPLSKWTGIQAESGNMNSSTSLLIANFQ